ncbi:MAG: GNAT family N-acetyltransferase [Aquabacterium sp.]|nr:GNAT family N-acetyltransferase [Ferruginibacter sp.]
MILAIRKATPKDFPAILCLIQEFAVFQKTPAKVTITLAQMEKEKDFFQCFVAETSDQTIIGFASFYFTFYSWSGKGIYLDDLYVTEQYRQQKTGTQLLQSVINLGKEQHCKRMRWQVSNWNKSAIGFYKSIGATVDDVDINCDLNLSSLIINQYQPA